VTKKERLGDMLMEGVRELEAILASGRHPRDVLTVRTVAVIDAWDFNAKGVKAAQVATDEHSGVRRGDWRFAQAGGAVGIGATKAIGNGVSSA